MKKIRLILSVLLVGSIAACGTTHRAAPVSERTISGTAKSTAEDRNFYTVKKGDTLYRIALDYGQSYSELVTWNKLANPNDIKVDQVLRVAPPESVAGSSRSGGAQTGAVTTSSGAETRALPAPSGSKTNPRGEKRPYSDTTLAEMQKTDSANGSPPAKPAVVAPSDKPAEPPAAAAATDDETVSWMWPAEGRVVANFDDNKKGIDIAGKSGQQVLAAGAGKVMYAGSGIRGYGNLVIVKHTSTLLSAYAHNKAIHVKEGQNVSKGQKIADMGDSDADAVKLHFEIRQQGKPVDPAKFLPSR
jgi:lipoprotein NlpD